MSKDNRSIVTTKSITYPPYSILKMDKMIKQMLSENEVKDKVFILDGQLYTQTRNVNGNLFIRLMPFDEVGEWMNKNIEGWFVFNTSVYLLFYKVSEMKDFFITYGSDLVDIYDEEEYAGIDKVVKFVTKHDQDKFFKELDHEITGM